MAERPIHHGVDLGRVARRQRFLLWCVLLCVVSYCSFPFLMIPSAAWGAGPPPGWVAVAIAIPIVLISAYVAGLVAVWQLMSALRWSIVGRLVCMILLFMPVANLGVLVALSESANRAFRRVGIRVGFMGVADEVVRRRLLTNLCIECGYDLTGNVSGICPECGSPITRSI